MDTKDVDNTEELLRVADQIGTDEHEVVQSGTDNEMQEVVNDEGVLENVHDDGESLRDPDDNWPAPTEEINTVMMGTVQSSNGFMYRYGYEKNPDGTTRGYFEFKMANSDNYLKMFPDPSCAMITDLIPEDNGNVVFVGVNIIGTGYIGRWGYRIKDGETKSDSVDVFIETGDTSDHLKVIGNIIKHDTGGYVAIAQGEISNEKFSFVIRISKELKILGVFAVKCDYVDENTTSAYLTKALSYGEYVYACGTSKSQNGASHSILIRLISDENLKLSSLGGVKVASDKSAHTSINSLSLSKANIDNSGELVDIIIATCLSVNQNGQLESFPIYFDMDMRMLQPNEATESVPDESDVVNDGDTAA